MRLCVLICWPGLNGAELILALLAALIIFFLLDKTSAGNNFSGLILKLNRRLNAEIFKLGGVQAVR